MRHELLLPIGLFVAACVIGLLWDWIDGKAIRIDPKVVILPVKRPITWFKNEHKVDRRTGLEFSYYMLIIRLPSYCWGYQINNDDWGWMQRAIVWCSCDPNPGAAYGPSAGFSIQELMP